MPNGESIKPVAVAGFGWCDGKEAGSTGVESPTAASGGASLVRDRANFRDCRRVHWLARCGPCGPRCVWYMLDYHLRVLCLHD